MSKQTVTFVSAFLDLHEDRSSDKSYEVCFNLFRRLAHSTINICLFVSQTYLELARELCKEYSNIYLMPSIELADTWTYKTTQDVFTSLPDIKTSQHDTYNFLVLMNAKVEFVYRATEINPFDTNHFAWIDFSICHVIHESKTLDRLLTYSKSSLRDKMMLFPGCWSKEYSNQNIHTIYNKIHLRFCGGFFIGDKDSIIHFNECYRKYYYDFLKEHKRLVWEVNYWEWLENKGYFVPEVYLANHNDSIVNIPSEYLKMVACLTVIPPRFEQCKLTIQSLLHQVDHIYVSVSKKYKRFGDVELPNFSNEENFKNRVSIVESIDYGPVTKYIGALLYIPETTWIFFCDDDQEYHLKLIHSMKQSIHTIGAYQNRYNIVKKGSGGIIHGYVGNMFHRSLLTNLLQFDLPPCSRFVDDQLMSIYCFINNIKIFPTSQESYTTILHILKNGYEQIGIDSLASLGNRDAMITELAKHFKVKFKSDGEVEYE